jgi:hypothetical protein
MLPSPVTIFKGKDNYRTIVKSAYKARILDDKAMHDIPALIKYGHTVFDDLTNLVDLTDISSIQAEEKPSFLPDNFQPIKNVAAELILKFKPHNGTASLIRGYYKLLPIPETADAFGYETWRTPVLFNEDPTFNEIYKYDCNVGPLLNVMAIQRNLSTKKTRQFKKDDWRKINKIVGRIIYVSSSDMVKIPGSKNFNPKEVLWFTW